MSIFVMPSIARGGFSYTKVKRIFLGMNGRIGPLRTLLDPYEASGVAPYSKYKLRGELVTQASGQLLGIETSRNNCLIRNGRLISFLWSFATNLSEPKPEIYWTDDGREFRRALLPFGEGVNRHIGGWCVYGTRIWVFMGSGESCYSDDNATTWTVGPTIPNIRITCAAASASAVVVGGGMTGGNGTLRYSTDPLTSAFVAVNPNVGTRDISDVKYNGSNLFVATAYEFLSTAPAAGNVWTSRSVPLDAALGGTYNIMRTNAGRWFVAAYGDQWITSTNGTSWSDARTSFPFWGAYTPNRQINYIDLNGDLNIHWDGKVSVFNGTSFVVSANKGLPVAQPMFVGQLSA